MMVLRLLGPILALLLSPLLLGVITRVKAVAGGRKGQPLLQLYFDLFRLLGKGAVYSTTTTWVFRLGPALALAASGTALIFVPFGPLPPLAQFSGDLVLFAYLLALGRLGLVLAALDTGSAFEGMGASREVTFSALAEPALFLALGGLAWVRQDLSLAGLLASGAERAVGAPALALASGALFLVLLAENSRIPVDDPTTHLELTMVHEVMVLDHSGPDFALILYGGALKLWLFAALFVLPWVPAGLPFWAGLAVFLGGMCLAAVAVGLVESLTARLRLSRVPGYLALAAVLAGLADLILFTGGRP